MKFASQEGRLKIAVFNSEGERLLSTEGYEGEELHKNNYPSETWNIISTEQWKSWNKWDTDIYYTEENCCIKLNDTQYIEILDGICGFIKEFYFFKRIVILAGYLPF
ncbi:MAG: hypothetical protein KAG97_09775 [Victivallales bacterium]|nr:hypothetical protein [Victivallales bacterium]